jgi:Mg2+-importing ATPase
MNDPVKELQAYAAQSVEDILKHFNSSLTNGLTSTEALNRVSTFGQNELQKPKKDILVLFLKQFISPFIMMLLIMGSIALMLKEYINGIFIITGVLINIIVTWVQEYKSARYLQTLQKYLFCHVHVKRDGTIIEILNRDLVPGDIIFVKRGDIIPADVRFLEVHDLTVDQSTLTGESIPVDKCAQEKTMNTIYDAYNIGFMGTAITNGTAHALVIAIGKSTYLGQTLNSNLSTFKESQFLHKIRQFSYYMTLIIVIAITLLFLLSLLFKKNIDAFDLMIFSIALAISITPESLPAIVTFSLSRAIHALTLDKVIVKQFTALQDLGSLELLCVDKTGTLTENELQVKDVFAYESSDLLFMAAQINDFPPSKDFDQALIQALTPEQQTLLAQQKRIYMRSFDSNTRSTFGVITEEEHNQNDFLCIARGSFDALTKICEPLPAATYEQYNNWYLKKSDEGYRVLAVGFKKVGPQDDWQKEEHSLSFAGLISFEDPIKKTATEAITLAQRLGVIIKVISGDNREVCTHVAKQLQLIESTSQIMDGQQYAQLDGQQKEKSINDTTVFAHMLPEQKLDVLSKIEKTYITGYLGDGINDIPALNKANVAISVENANDMVRDAADIILLKKSLMPIVKGIKESRSLFANINKYMIITMTGNFGNCLSLAISSFVIPYLPMLPVQIIIVNLLCDLPMLAIATDHVDIEELKNPHKLDLAHLFTVTAIFAIISSAFDLFYFALFKQYDQQTLQTGWFILNILTELVVIFSLRSRQSFITARGPSWTLISLSIMSTLIALSLPYSIIGQTYFSFVTLHHLQLMIIIALTMSYFMATESTKWLLNRLGLLQNR